MNKQIANNTVIFLNRVELKGAQEVQAWTEIMAYLQGVLQQVDVNVPEVANKEKVAARATVEKATEAKAKAAK